MSVRAKFQVVERTEYASGSGGGKTQERVVLTAASGKGNESWSRWTPSGRIDMNITNEAALNQFPVGAHVYVDFTPAPAEEETLAAAAPATT